MRPRLTGLGQIRGSTPGKKGVSPFQTTPLPLLSSIEEEIILWYGVYRLEWGWEADRGLGGHGCIAIL
jgi:hypothetical protein